MSGAIRPAHHYDVVVIGAGLSGLTAAAALAESQVRVLLVAKGGGFLHFTTGCVDVLGADTEGKPVRQPLPALDALAGNNPVHPYALIDRGSLESGLDLYRRVMEATDIRFAGGLDRNITLPTAIGSTRTTCLVPSGMISGDLNDTTPMLIAGLAGFRDFHASYIAANLRTAAGFPIHHSNLDLPQLKGRRHLLSLDVARAFDEPSVRDAAAKQVRLNLQGAGRVGFPAVLGLDHSHQAVNHLQDLIGLPVFEIPTLPPSVAGIRVHEAFRKWSMKRGVRLEIGFWVQGRLEQGRATEIVVQSAGHETRYTAGAYVLATGGTGGGGITAHADGRLRETVFDLPVEGPSHRSAWARSRFLATEPQPISLVGIRTNTRLQPQDAQSQVVADNVFVTASNLRCWDATREKSGEGVALATGWKAAQEALACASRWPAETVASFAQMSSSG